VQHNISYSLLKDNGQGAISYASAGEVNPAVTMEWNQFNNNCKKLYGNFTTCQAAVDLDIQNTQSVYFRVRLCVKCFTGKFRSPSDSNRCFYCVFIFFTHCLRYWLLLQSRIVQSISSNCDNFLICCAPHLSSSNHSWSIHQSSLVWVAVDTPSSEAGETGWEMATGFCLLVSVVPQGTS
jgi:hypothetical protein